MDSAKWSWKKVKNIICLENWRKIFRMKMAENWMSNNFFFLLHVSCQLATVSFFNKYFTIRACGIVQIIDPVEAFSSHVGSALLWKRVYTRGKISNYETVTLIFAWQWVGKKKSWTGETVIATRAHGICDNRFMFFTLWKFHRVIKFLWLFVSRF